MKPGRLNYEIWLIDWLDGILTPEQTEQLMAFFDENPDIREEAELLKLSRLITTADVFSGKKSLNKSLSELPDSQIEYLSIAYLENDLSSEQAAELKLNTNLNSNNRKVFDAIQKTRLVPYNYHFRGKSHLKKVTPWQKTARFLIIGFSAAASVTILILSYFFASGYFSGRNEVEAYNQISDSILTKPFIVRTNTIYHKPDEKILKNAGNKSPITNAVTPPNPKGTDYLALNTPTPGTPGIIRDSSVVEISRIPVSVNIDFGRDINRYSLIASTNDFPLITDDDTRSRLSKFIARTFRQKILNEGVPDDTPVKPYELAEAGIAGLNKLLGWDMTLVRTNDEEGNPKSFYFSSRVLKFNAPVKKSEFSQ